MWYKIVSYFTLAEDNEPGGLKKLLPVIFIFVLYVVSGLFKNRQGKKPTETPIPKNRPQPAPPAKQSPRHSSGQPKTPSGQTHQPPTPQPGSVMRQPVPVPRPVSQPPKPSQPVPQTMQGAMGKQVVPSIQTKLTERKEPLVSAAHKSGAVSTGAIPLGFTQPDELARAILYAEILGNPVGMRPMGSYDYRY
jgi:hypothetical protein